MVIFAGLETETQNEVFRGILISAACSLRSPQPGFPLAWIFLGLAVILPVIVYFLKMIRKPAF